MEPRATMAAPPAAPGSAPLAPIAAPASAPAPAPVPGAAPPARPAAAEAEHDRDVALRERLAMADELHDLLAHELSLVTVQLAAARQIAARDAEAADRALEIATGACRTCLSSIRRVAGLGSLEAHVRYGPQPGIADLDVLAGLARDAGGSLTLPDDPAVLATVPRDVALCAFRAIEILLGESAGREPALTVAFAGSAVTLLLLVPGDGPPPIAAGAGLVRLAERVDVFGGRLHLDRAGDAWRVRVSLPTMR